ncbi:MAG: hypothetical protein CMB77_07415 [Euryarchaeota archaeon]|nr:hypothetical protein [Euryarchaeota archaeon]
MTGLTESQCIAAAVAVIKILTAEEDLPRSDVGRNPGPAWTQDHLRMRFGRSPLTSSKNWQRK